MLSVINQSVRRVVSITTCVTAPVRCPQGSPPVHHSQWEETYFADL